MKTTFYIVVHVRTPKELKTFGRFEIGNDRELARYLFGTLKGRSLSGRLEEGIIHIDLMETRNGLPVNLQIMYCTLAELGENVQLITKEVFKSLALREISS